MMSTHSSAPAVDFQKRGVSSESATTQPRCASDFLVFVKKRRTYSSYLASGTPEVPLETSRRAVAVSLPSARSSSLVLAQHYSANEVFKFGFKVFKFG